MSVLSEKMRRARELREPVGGFTFVLLRPTPEDVAELRGRISAASLKRFVIGWEGVKEIDLIPGGDGALVPFDVEACMEWLADRPDLMAPLGTAILKAYTDYTAKLGEQQKN
jgi:hypothetical protein